MTFCEQWRQLAIRTITRLPKTFTPSLCFLQNVFPQCASLTELSNFGAGNSISLGDATWFAGLAIEF